MFYKKIIHAIATTDSDFWALLDCPCLLFNLSSDLKAFVAASVSIHEADEKREKPFHHLTRFGAIVRATVYGNDYFKGLKGVAEGTLEPLMATYKDDKLGLFRHLCVNYPAFLPLYQKVEGIYYNAPVFEMTVVDGEDRAGPAVILTGRIVSHCDEVLSPNSWEKIFGFDPEKLLFEKFLSYVLQSNEQDCAEAALRNWCAVDIGLGIWSAVSGTFFCDHLVKRNKNDRGEDLPYGWDLDFDACPVHHQPERTLDRWIAVRGFSRRKRHNNISEIVKRLKELQVNVMTEADADVLLPKSSRYSGMEVLIPASTTCTWEKNDLSNLRRVRFSEEYLLKIFGKRNGVRARALQRLRNGHFFLDTLESAKVKKECVATVQQRSSPSYGVMSSRASDPTSIGRISWSTRTATISSPRTRDAAAPRGICFVPTCLASFHFAICAN